MKPTNALRPLTAALFSLALACAAAMAQTAEPARPQNLVAHWRNTRIVFESPRDEHLVLRGDGSAETWTVTASGKSAPVRGRWDAQARTLSIDWEDGAKWSRPFTFYQRQLVFPNVQNRRKFWDRLD